MVWNCLFFPHFQHLCLIPWWPHSSSADLYEQGAPLHSFSLSRPSRSEMPLALVCLVHSRKYAHCLEPVRLFHSISHFPYLLPLNCWAGCLVINSLLTQVALSKSLSNLMQASILARSQTPCEAFVLWVGRHIKHQKGIAGVRERTEQIEDNLGCICTLSRS